MQVCAEIDEQVRARIITEPVPLYDYIVIGAGSAGCREARLSLLHPVGTYKMGVGDDGVVDPRLRLVGIENLRVIDASIMPRIVTGNTNAAKIVIGEKAAALVLDNARR